MSPLTRVINAIHHGQLSPRQRDLLIALLLNLQACTRVTCCPEMSQVQTAYRELLAAGSPAPVMIPHRAPLTLDQLIEQLTRLRARYPAHGWCTCSTWTTTETVS